MFTLHCTNLAGESVRLCYDPHTSTLANVDGTPVLASSAAGATQWEAVHRVSAQSPGHKLASPKTLKIQLGLSCNYTCSYCNQSSQVDAMAMTRTADAESFLNELGTWLKESPARIELWGGEPLLYFKKLQILVPELDRRFPDAELSMVTNGSLLNEEILAFIASHDILISVSHDGPGQHLRGMDPFDDERLAFLLRSLWQERKGRHRMTFNSVLTPDNHDPVAIRRWFVEKIGDEDVVTSLEGVVAVHDNEALAGPGVWTSDQYRELREAIASSFETGEALRIPALTEKARGFWLSVQHAAPSSAMGQKCGMDRSDALAVDLHSNVLTCQNTGANSKHGLGSALNLENVRLDTSTHWAYRECCNHCPSLQFCGGSCMYLEGEQFAQSCENEFQFGLGMLDGVLRRALGLRLTDIEGDIRRPTRRKTIPIIAMKGDACV